MNNVQTCMINSEIHTLKNFFCAHSVLNDCHESFSQFKIHCNNVIGLNFIQISWLNKKIFIVQYITILYHDN